jgi:hypothetical protein
MSQQLLVKHTTCGKSESEERRGTLFRYGWRRDGRRKKRERGYFRPTETTTTREGNHSWEIRNVSRAGFWREGRGTLFGEGLRREGRGKKRERGKETIPKLP